MLIICAGNGCSDLKLTPTKLLHCNKMQRGIANRAVGEIRILILCLFQFLFESVIFASKLLSSVLCLNLERNEHSEQ